MTDLSIRRNQSPFRRAARVSLASDSLLSNLVRVERHKGGEGQGVTNRVRRHTSAHPSSRSPDFTQGSFAQMSHIQPIPSDDFDFMSIRTEGFQAKRRPKSGSEISTTRQGSWLESALGQLRQVDEEAGEEGYPKVSGICKANAQAILTELARGIHQLPTVYPTADGEIAILFQRRNVRASVLILCEKSGAAVCFSTIGGKRSRANYEDAKELPDSFVNDKLLKLRLAA